VGGGGARRSCAGRPCFSRSRRFTSDALHASMKRPTRKLRGGARATSSSSSSAGWTRALRSCRRPNWLFCVETPE
jgi:hypothetical protein